MKPQLNWKQAEMPASGIVDRKLPIPIYYVENTVGNSNKALLRIEYHLNKPTDILNWSIDINGLSYSWEGGSIHDSDKVKLIAEEKLKEILEKVLSLFTPSNPVLKIM